MAAMSEAAENYEPAAFLRFVIETSGYLDLLRQKDRKVRSAWRTSTN